MKFPSYTDLLIALDEVVYRTLGRPSNSISVGSRAFRKLDSQTLVSSAHGDERYFRGWPVRRDDRLVFGEDAIAFLVDEQIVLLLRLP